VFFESEYFPFQLRRNLEPFPRRSVQGIHGHLRWYCEFEFYREFFLARLAGIDSLYLMFKATRSIDICTTKQSERRKIERFVFDYSSEPSEQRDECARYYPQS